MYYLDDSNAHPAYVSIATGKQYFFRDYNSEDQLRALKQLEADDTPAPEPEPQSVTIVHAPQRETIDMGAYARTEMYEMRLQQLRNK
jgi:hypothetical protein